MKRRVFIGKTSLAVASIGIPTIVPASVFGKHAPSNRVTVGLIGTGRQGFGQNLQGSSGATSKIPGLLDIPEVQVVSVCDVDRWRMAKAKTVVESHYAKGSSTGSYKGCSADEDFRKIIERPDIDAVMISTPDYWHVPMAILAAKAKKHISCEKPLSMSVHQGRQLVDILKKHPVINRTDSEFRSVRPQNLSG